MTRRLDGRMVRLLGMLLLGFFMMVSLTPAEAKLVPARSGGSGGPGNKLDSVKRLYGQSVESYLEKAKSFAGQVASSGNASQFSSVLENLNEAAEKISAVKEKIENWNISGAEADQYLAELNAQYQSTFSEAFNQCESILIAGLAQKAAPKNVYSAASKSKFHHMIMADWKAAWPNDNILGIRFPNAAFKQTVNEKRWDSDKRARIWVKKSALVAKVIVQVSPKLAAIYPAYINRDDVTGKVNAGVYTKGGGYIIDLMLVSNFK
ncbi:MAG: hypothetical protein QME05_03710 [Candidatus Margulisbacteria bacterium]|nr:hypothetical protein [Candidatus Margulisiibacteriota bacterium]